MWFRLESFARASKAFVEESKKFYLSHRGPVPSPIESAVTHDASTWPELGDFIVDSFHGARDTNKNVAGAEVC